MDSEQEALWSTSLGCLATVLGIVLFLIILYSILDAV